MNLSPIATICATVSFLAMIASFVLLVIVAPDEAGDILRPLIPTFASIGTAAVIYLKASSNRNINSQENAKISKQAEGAATTAVEVKTELNQRLNGDLDERIKQAVLDALEERNNNGLG